MLEFNNAIEIAFKDLSKERKIIQKKIDTLDKEIFKKFKEVWSTTIDIKNEAKKIEEVKILIGFTDEFPLTIPNIYLDHDSKQKFWYLPHIDSDKNICTFDDETTIVNPKLPSNIINSCIIRARQILEDGLNNKNVNDYFDEFYSYWINRYDKREIIDIRMLSLIEEINDSNINNIRILILSQELNKYQFVLHTQNEVANNFKSYLQIKKVEYTEELVFPFPEFIVSGIPPYDIKVGDLFKELKKVTSERIKEFQDFVNNKQRSCFITIKVELNSKIRFLPVGIKDINANRNGFRRGKLSLFSALKTFHQGDRLIRYLPDIFNQERIEFRSSGLNDHHNFSFAFAGLGSLGSNLVHFLNNTHVNKYKFVDNDILKTENIGRHLLGFSFVRKNKCDALKNYLLEKNPLLTIDIKDESIVSTIKNSPGFINDSDYLFVAIGKQNIEEFIAKSIEQRIIKTPTFFIWVEPYLVGGHLIFIHPENEIKFDLFFENGLFKYNVIDSSEYRSNNPILLKKEAGCNTNFIPYSGENVILFLSSLYPLINKIIYNDYNSSCSYTWMGNTERLIQNGIKINPKMIKYDIGKLISNEL